jgi:hypothetical protein
MKQLILPIFLLCTSLVFAQKIKKTERVTDYSIHIIGNNFEGVVFSDKYELTLSFTNGKKFTPTESDIVAVEKLLNSSLDTIQDQTHQNIFICRHLNHYLRQYFGYINENGDKIISINLFWKNADIKRDVHWLKDVNITEDGGDHYWQIKANLKSSKLFNYQVNGVG